MKKTNVLFQIELTRGAKTLPGSRENVWGAINAPSQNQAIADVRTTTDEDRKKELKKNLAGGLLHVKKIKDGKRLDANVEEESIFVGVDVDHVSAQGITNIREHFEQHILPIKEELHLVWSWITFSNDGMRLVVHRPSNANIAETQQWVANKIGLKHDTKCKDKARLFFLPGKDDILYMDEEALFGEKELMPYTINSQAQELYPSAITAEKEDDAIEEQRDVENLEVFGIKMVDLVEKVLINVAKHPLPLVSSERNNVLFQAACKIRPIECNLQRLVNLFMPLIGLDRKEVTDTIKSALNNKMNNESIRYDVRQIIRELRTEAGLVSGNGLLPCRPLPSRLAPLFMELANISPQGFAPSVLLSILPLAGGIATHVRFDYLDGQEHSLSFHTHIKGDFASGKSFLNWLSDILLYRIKQSDTIARVAEQEYEKQLKLCKNNNKEQPVDPRPIIREVPITISIAKLMKRIDQAQGQHLISVTDEIDTAYKTNRAGAWSEKTDIYRKSFDNSTYGMDYLSENSYSGIFKLYYNTLTGGTMNSTMKYFQPHVEDGYVSRVAFSSLPDNFAGQMPIFKKLTANQKTTIEHCIDLLEQAEGKIQIPKILKTISEWLEEKRQLASETQSIAIDSFRRRAAVIGTRAGALAYILSGRKETKAVREFVLWVADYVLQQQVAMWGNYMENQVEVKTAQLSNIFNELPETFTRQQLIELRTIYGKPRNERMNIKRWKDDNMIREVGKNLYAKISIKQA